MPRSPYSLRPYQPQWRDGQPYSAEFQDTYHSHGNRLGGQAIEVFLAGCKLPQSFRAMSSDAVWTIAEIGCGPMVNFLQTATAFLDNAPKGARLSYLGLDKGLWERDALAKLYANFPSDTRIAELSQELLKAWPQYGGNHRLYLAQGRIALTLAFGDVREELPRWAQWKDLVRVQSWYLDGFAPKRNPEAWDNTVLQAIASFSATDARLATWCVAGDLRRRLQKVGFCVQRKPGYANKRHRLEAFWPDSGITSMNNQPKSHVCKALIRGAGISGSWLAHSLALRGWQVSLHDNKTKPQALPVGLLHVRLNSSNGLLATLDAQALAHGLRALDGLNAPNIYRRTDIKELLSNKRSLRRAKRLLRRTARQDLFQQLADGVPDVASIQPEPQSQSEPRQWLRSQLGAVVSVPELLDRLHLPPGVKLEFGSASATGMSAQIDVWAAGDAGPAAPWVHGKESSLWMQSKASANSAPATPLTGHGWCVHEQSLQAGSMVGLGESLRTDLVALGKPSESSAFKREIYHGTRWYSKDGLPVVSVLANGIADNAAASDLKELDPAMNTSVTEPHIFTAMGAFALARAPLCADLMADMMTGLLPPVPYDLAQALQPSAQRLR